MSDDSGGSVEEDVRQVLHVIAAPIMPRSVGWLATDICVLGERWRVRGDNSQWIVEHFIAPKWRQVAYVASCKAVLERVLREKGVPISPDSRRALDCLPGRFFEWRAQQRSVAQKLENDVALDDAEMRGVGNGCTI